MAAPYACVADEYGGLQVIDISNPTNPQLVGRYSAAMILVVWRYPATTPTWWRCRAPGNRHQRPVIRPYNGNHALALNIMRQMAGDDLPSLSQKSNK